MNYKSSEDCCYIGQLDSNSSNVKKATLRFSQRLAPFLKRQKDIKSSISSSKTHTKVLKGLLKSQSKSRLSSKTMC